MTFYFNPNRFILKEFLSYPTTVCDRINEFKSLFGDEGDEDVKDFFEACIKEAKNQIGKDLSDNKVAFKVFDNATNNTFYVGYKDNIWCIGLSVNPYSDPCYRINFETKEKTTTWNKKTEAI